MVDVDVINGESSTIQVPPCRIVVAVYAGGKLHPFSADKDGDFQKSVAMLAKEHGAHINMNVTI